MSKWRNQKRNARIVRRVLGRLGVVLLGLLTVAAAILHAPLKVIALLLIFLAACTILPKAWCKWFWLSIGLVVISLIIWVFLPDDDEGWRPYTFDEDLAALRAKYAVPDERNAALDYDEIFETFDIDTGQPEFFTYSKPSSINGPWLSKDHPETAEWLRGHRNTIEKLLQVTQKDKCVFPIAADTEGFGRRMERLAPMRRLAFLLLSAANNDIAEGRIEAGLEKYLCIIQMADHLYQQPVMIDSLVGYALEGLALTGLNRFVIEDKPTADQLKLIGNSIRSPEDNWGSDFIKVLEYEKLHHKNTFCSLAYEVNPEGKVRLSRDPLAAFRDAHAHELPTPTYLRRKLNKARTILSRLHYPSSPEKMAKTIDTSYEKYYAMAKPGYDWSEEPAEFRPRWRVNFRSVVESLTRIHGSTYHRIHEIYLRNLCSRRGSRVIILPKNWTSG